MTTTKKLQRHTQTLSGHHSQWCEISGTLNNKTPPLLLVLVVTRIGNEPVPHAEELQNPQWNTGDMSAGITSSDASANPNMLDNTSLYGYMSVEPRMRSEQDRLRTFHAWPSDAPVSSAELAKAGFFFLGPGDKVQCFCCGGILRQWVRGDCPWNEHVRHFPTCSFILSRNVGNIPHVITQGSSDSVDGQVLSQLQRMTVEEVTGGQPAYPEMETEQSRVTTFHTWPPHAPVQPQILARAGFFYTGQSDNVKCFYCDGGLRNWESGDDPWQEHAKWFPRCEFLLQARGRDYVNNIQESYFNTGGLGSGSLSSGAGEITSGRDVVGNQDLSPLLQSPAIQTVLQMGFDHSLVESLVQTKYLLTGNRYTSVSDLVSDILQAEEEDRHRSDQARETSESPRQSTSAGEARETQQSEEKAGDRSPEEQLRQLQEERTCKVCMDKVVSIVFIPCGHLVVCSDCAASLSNCPICRAVIRGSVRAFMS